MGVNKQVLAPVGLSFPEVLVPRTSAAIGLAAILAACGGDSSGPAVPQNLQISGGNGQTGPAGGSPPLALRVVVTGSSGQAFQGAQVAWQVTSGGGSVNPVSSTTDAAGQATTVVTLGPAGTTSVRATVGSLAPVMFQITSVNPCAYLAPFREDTTVTAALSTSDCPFTTRAGTFIDFYDLGTSQQRTLLITMQANPIDAYLLLWDFAGPQIAVDDDGGTGTNSRLKAILRAGDWVVGANSYNPGEVGAYTLSAVPVATTVSLCEEVWISGAVTVTETITNTDCFFTDTTTDQTYYSDWFGLILFAGQSITLTQSGPLVDPYLSLFRIDSDTLLLVAWDDNSGGGTTARLVYTAPSVPAGAIYILDVGTAPASQTGAYTLSVGTITGPAPPLAGASGFQPAPHKRLDLPRARLGRALRRP
jgi:Big-like domain-containing protein